MEAERLKSLRLKQLLFLNGVTALTFFVLCGVIIGIQPSIADVYRVVFVLMLGSIIIELGSIRRPDRFRFWWGPTFIHELIAYEREKLGKQQDTKSRAVRIVLQAFLAVQFMIQSVMSTSRPIVIEDVADFLKFYTMVGCILLVAMNVTIIYRGYSIDRARPDQLGSHILQTVVVGIVVGVLALVAVGAVISQTLR